MASKGPSHMVGRCRARQQVLMSITLQGAVWEQVNHRVMWVTCVGLEDGPWELLPLTEHGIFKQWFNMLPSLFCFSFFSLHPLSPLFPFIFPPLLIFFLSLVLVSFRESFSRTPRIGRFTFG